MNLTLIDPTCSNLTCPNRIGEGQYFEVETETPVVGGHRPIRFRLCGPCASEFMKLLK